MFSLHKSSKALDTDILGIVVSKLEDYNDIIAFCDISDAHRNVSYKFVTSMRNSKPIPAWVISSFTRLETIDGFLDASAADNVVDVAMWVLSRSEGAGRDASERTKTQDHNSLPVRIMYRSELGLSELFTVDCVLALAAENGNRKAVDLCIKKGAADWNTAMERAARAGHREIIDLCVEKGADDWNRAMVSAAGGGRLEIVELCAKNGADEWNNAMSNAATVGHRGIVELCAENGANEWEMAVANAKWNEKREIVALLCHLATMAGHHRIAELCSEESAAYWSTDVAYFSIKRDLVINELCTNRGVCRRAFLTNGEITW